MGTKSSDAFLHESFKPKNKGKERVHFRWDDGSESGIDKEFELPREFVQFAPEIYNIKQMERIHYKPKEKVLEFYYSRFPKSVKTKLEPRKYAMEDVPENDKDRRELQPDTLVALELGMKTAKYDPTESGLNKIPTFCVVFLRRKQVGMKGAFGNAMAKVWTRFGRWVSYTSPVKVIVCVFEGNFIILAFPTAGTRRLASDV